MSRYHDYGLLRDEAGNMIHHMVKCKGYFTLEALNAAIADLREAFELPLELPCIHFSILATEENGGPKNSLRFKAAETHEFARYRSVPSLSDRFCA